MSKLFAALDQTGEIQFVGDVARGAACGCFCPVCLSPLVAKQGDQNEWHFAHEADQERPECLAGAINLLRHVGVEQLMSSPPEKLGDFITSVQLRSWAGLLEKQVRWSVNLIRPWQWVPKAAQGAPVAGSEIQGGIPVHLHVQVADSLPSSTREHEPGHAILLLWIATPSKQVQLRTRKQVLQFIESNSSMHWLHMPDQHGLVLQATQELQELAQQEKDRLHRAAAQRQQQAGHRWAQIRNRMEFRGVGAGDETIAEESIASPQTDPRAGRHPAGQAPPTANYPWAPERKPGSSFLFFRLKDGSAWVVYSLADGGSGIAPWGTPEEIDGWDEALPASIGTPDTGAGIYRASSPVGAIMFFNGRVAATRSSSNPEDFMGL